MRRCFYLAALTAAGTALAACRAGRPPASAPAPAPAGGDSVVVRGAVQPDGWIRITARRGCDVPCQPATAAWVIDGRVLRPRTSTADSVAVARLATLPPSSIAGIEVLGRDSAAVRFGAWVTGPVIVIETVRAPAGRRSATDSGARLRWR